MTQTKAQTIEGELIFGALQREKQWKLVSIIMGCVGLLGVATAASVVLRYSPPPPVLIPYNPETGVAIPNASVKPVTLTEEAAVVEAAVYRYVMDREAYNQLDNDLRIGRALATSDGAALASLQSTWNSNRDSYPPVKYGAAIIEVNVTSIARISNDRAQVRLTKRLQNKDGSVQGSFTAIIAYSFDPNTEKRLETVWQNPFGFSVTDYTITADKRSTF